MQVISIFDPFCDSCEARGIRRKATHIVIVENEAMSEITYCCDDDLETTTTPHGASGTWEPEGDAA